MTVWFAEDFGKDAPDKAFDKTNLLERVSVTSSSDLIENSFFDRAKTRRILIAFCKTPASIGSFTFAAP